MKAIVSYNLQLEVGEGKCECGLEEAHCHVTRNGCTVAKVFLNPFSIEEGHLLEPDEVECVSRLVSENMYKLLKGFVDNRDNVVDY